MTSKVRLSTAIGATLIALAACSDQDDGWTKITVVPEPEQTDQDSSEQIDPVETSNPNEIL